MQRTLVTFLLDRTGSMSFCKEATIEAFNGYLDALKTGDPAEIEFTFLQFDGVSLDKICVAEDLAKVKPLTDKTYEPRASTPLIDAAFKTIKAIEAALTKRDDKPKIVVCIQTDGFENASTEHTMAELNALIKEKIALGWQFNFMGAGIDAYAQGKQMGIMPEATVAYNRSDRHATKMAFAASAGHTRSFAAGMSMNTHYNAGDRMAAKDEYAPPDLQKKPDLTAKSAMRPKSLVDDIKL